VYDKQLGSNIYYKHARTYRFPTLTDIINTNYPSLNYAPFPIYPLGPEEGTLEEWSVRHWFTPEIYFAATYYDLDMDNEIMGEWYTSTQRWNANVPLVNHNGVELEGLIKLTPRWTLKGNMTKQKVIYRSYSIGRTSILRLADKWVPMNPAYMYNASLSYDNKEWGFSAGLTFRYAGSRYFQGDDLNMLPDVDAARIADLSISQDIFDGSANIYFGINNINDCMSTFNTYTYTSLGQQVYWIYPDAGRTYYMGLKSNMDFDRMKLPTWSDLNRMQRRLYGAANESYNSFTGMGSWMRNMVSF
jgi:iron complex outermembrane receptor protein